MRKPAFVLVLLLAVAAVVFLLWDRGEPTSVDSGAEGRQRFEDEALEAVLRGSDPVRGPASSTAPSSSATPSPPSATVLPEDGADDGRARLVVRVVRRSDDVPLEGADVRVLAADGTRESLLTPASGEVEFAREKATRVAVLVTHGDHAPSSYGPLKLQVGKTLSWVVRIRTGVGVRGVVLREEDGRPVAGARLLATEGGRVGTTMSARSDAVLGAVETDREGRFAFAALPHEEICTITVRAEGLRTTQHAFIPKDVTGQEDGIMLRLERGGRLTGRVYDPDGRPVAGALVRLDREKALLGVSDADGAYVVDGLEFERRYTVVAIARGFARSEKVENVFATSAAPGIGLDLVVRRPGGLLVRLVDPTGVPIEGKASLYLGPSPNSRWRGRPEGSLPGTWRFASVDPGSHGLHIDVPGYVQRSRPVTIREGRVTEEIVTLQEGTQISGTVVDDQGIALGDVVVTAGLSFEKKMRGRRHVQDVTARTDRNGRFRLRGLEGGPFEIDARSRSCGSVKLVDVPAATTDLRIVLPRMAKVTFRLRLPPGTAPPEGITIWTIGGRGARWKEEPYVVHVRSGTSGVAVEGRGFATWATQLDLEPAEEIDLGTVVLDTGVTLTVRVTNRAGRPVPDATVGFVHRVLPGSASGPPRTDDDGLCGLPHLNPGEYRVRVTSDAYLMRTKKVDVPAQGTSVTMTLDAGGLVQGTVVNASGDPVIRQTVHFHRHEGPTEEQGRWYGRTDGRGRFEERLPEGHYRAEVKEKDRVLASAEVAVTEGSTQQIELRLVD